MRKQQQLTRGQLPLQVTTVSTFHHCDRMPEVLNLEEDRFILAHGKKRERGKKKKRKRKRERENEKEEKKKRKDPLDLEGHTLLIYFNKTHPLTFPAPPSNAVANDQALWGTLHVQSRVQPILTGSESSSMKLTKSPLRVMFTTWLESTRPCFLQLPPVKHCHTERPSPPAQELSRDTWKSYLSLNSTDISNLVQQAYGKMLRGLMRAKGKEVSWVSQGFTIFWCHFLCFCSLEISVERTMFSVA